MRKTIVLLVLAMSVIFTLGATASPASAANCSSITNGPTYWNGNLNFQANVTHCTGVDQVQFVNSCACSFPYPAISGWWDGTTSLSYVGSPTTSTSAIFSYNTTAYVTWSHAAWCGGEVHWVATTSIFRIHAAGGSWGPWHQYASVGYTIKC